MSKMSNFRSQWAKAEVKFASEFDVPEDGKYRVVIEDVKYSEVDFNNNPTDPTIIYIFRVIDGNCTGMRFRKFSTIRSEMNLSYLKGDLTRLGLPVPADPEELIAVFPSARGLTLEVTVKSRTIDGKVYKDCNIDRLYKAIHQKITRITTRLSKIDRRSQCDTRAIRSHLAAVTLKKFRFKGACYGLWPYALRAWLLAVAQYATPCLLKSRVCQ